MLILIECFHSPSNPPLSKKKYKNIHGKMFNSENKNNSPSLPLSFVFSVPEGKVVKDISLSGNKVPFNMDGNCLIFEVLPIGKLLIVFQ